MLHNQPSDMQFLFSSNQQHFVYDFSCLILWAEITMDFIIWTFLVGYTYSRFLCKCEVLLIFYVVEEKNYNCPNFWAKKIDLKSKIWFWFHLCITFKIWSFLTALNNFECSTIQQFYQHFLRVTRKRYMVFIYWMNITCNFYKV